MCTNRNNLSGSIGQFYADLSPVYDNVPKYGAVILTGHFNAKIGEEIGNQEVADKYKQHDVTRGNRQKLKQFALMYDLFVLSTKHEH